MKLEFNLAIITNENQKIEEVIEPYYNKTNTNWEENIKNKRNFIKGIIVGSINNADMNNEVLISKNKSFGNVSSSKISDVDWNKIVSEYNKENDGERMDLENKFALTHAIITPDKKWHGMMPINLIPMGFLKNEPQEEYIKNYYRKYIEPYKEDGTITIVTCQI